MSALAEHDAWRHSRIEYLTSPTGNLALVAFQPVDDEATEIEQLPGVTTWRSAEDAGVWINVPAEGPSVCVEGVPVTGDAFVARLRADGTPLITSGPYAIDAFSLDGSDYELRVYDANSAALEDFSHLEVYDYDPSGVLTGHLSTYDDNRLIPWEFTREADTGHVKNVPGVLSVSIDGVEHNLTAFVDSGQLVLVFADGTTKDESYKPGRFLRMTLPGADGVVEMDFNTAFIPPCGFSYFYSCPIPPEGERDLSADPGGRKGRRLAGSGPLSPDALRWQLKPTQFIESLIDRSGVLP
ncbi:MAG: DUF1684 domain-containing protein [Marmoricola sp.]